VHSGNYAPRSSPAGWWVGGHLECSLVELS
jgi:hypothetical protein